MWTSNALLKLMFSPARVADATRDAGMIIESVCRSYRIAYPL